MLDFSGSYAFNPLALPPLIVGSATLALGIAAVIRERGAATSLHFLLLNLTVALWLLSSAATYSATDAAAALRWSRLTHVGVHLIPGALYSFATNAVGVSERRRPLIWGTWLISGLFLALTPELVREVYPYWWGYFARYSWANVPFLIFFAAALTAAASEFWSAYRRAEPGSLAQRRSWLLLLALLVGYAASVDYLPAFGIPLYPSGYLPIVGFLGLSAAAIWRYRLVEITPALAAGQIIDTIGDALIVVDQEGVVRLANHAAEDLFGRKTSELLGKPPPTELGGDFAQRFEPLAETGRIGHFEATVESSQGERAVNFVVAGVLDERSRPVAFVCVGRDVTEQKQAEQEIRQLNVELELRVADRTAELAAMNRELETFADSVAHDLRAPILTISLYTQTLIDKHASDLGTEGKEPVDQILAAARRMDELIDDLLRLARASRAELRREPTDLSALARSIAGDFRKAEPLRKVDFVIADGLQAYGDSGLLRLALQDLLENAWKFTGKQAQATIEVGAMETDGGEINLFVRDDGAGFDMRYADKLFLPFERSRLRHALRRQAFPPV